MGETPMRFEKVRERSWKGSKRRWLIGVGCEAMGVDALDEYF
jgi:hypothetical protein